MTKFYKTILLSTFLLTNIVITYSQNAAIYSSTAINTKTGTLGGVPFIFSNFVNATQIVNFDLSGVDYSALPLSSNQPTFNYSSNENWTLTFSSPIQSLKLYCIYWRTTQVNFDQPFTIVSGGSGFQNPSGNLLNTTAFTNGIIQFNNPITTLTITVISGGQDAQIALTLGGGPALLATDDFAVQNNIIKLHPNPSSDFISISGLTISQNYKVYNILGTEMSSGIISGDKKIGIQNLTNGLYILKLDNANAIKFIKG